MTQLMADIDDVIAEREPKRREGPSEAMQLGLDDGVDPFVSKKDVGRLYGGKEDAVSGSVSIDLRSESLGVLYGATRPEYEVLGTLVWKVSPEPHEAGCQSRDYVHFPKAGCRLGVRNSESPGAKA